MPIGGWKNVTTKRGEIAKQKKEDPRLLPQEDAMCQNGRGRDRDDKSDAEKKENGQQKTKKGKRRWPVLGEKALL